LGRRATLAPDPEPEVIMADVTNRIPGSRIETVDLDEVLNVGRSRSVSVARDDRETVLGLKSVSAGRKLTLQAGDEIEISVGQARLVMKKDGTILISGRDVVIESSGTINVKATRDVVLKGKKILEN
jgi:type VI secretion system secreted protein VgrG